MNIYLLRHTESTSNQKGLADSNLDADLSEKGKTDAQALVKILAKNKYDVFVVSPLKRTLQTIRYFLKTAKSSSGLEPQRKT